MKRVKSNVERSGDNIKVTALFRTRWKKPGTVKVVQEPSETAAPEVVLEGDAGEVFDTMSALAEIAWDMGWRPAGLVPMLSHVINNFKQPKPE